MILRELSARLGLDIDDASFAAAETLFGAVRGGLVAIGAFAGAAAVGIAAAVTKTAEYADAIDKAAQRTGVAVEPLQALQYAAETAGVGVEGLQGAMAFMARRGVKDFEGEFRRAADELSRMPAGGARAARAMELFGKQGAALIPMLSGGAAGIDEVTAKARDMWLVLGPETIQTGAKLKTSIEDLQGYLRGLALTLGSKVLDPARKLVEALTGWVRANRAVIVTRFEQFARVLGTALRWTWQILEPFVKLFSALAKNTWVVRAAIVALSAALLAGLGGAAMKAAGSVMKLVGALLGLTAAEWLSIAVPVLLGVALLGLAAIVEDVYRFIRGEKSVLGELADQIHRVYGATLRINPDDNPLVIFLKNVGQALDGIKASFIFLANAPGWMGKLIGAQMVTNAPWRAVRKTAADLLASGALDERGRAAYFGGPAPSVPSVPYYLASPGLNVREINVTVQAPPGADPQRTGYDIAAAIRQQLGLEIGAAAGGLLLRPEGG